VARPQDTDVDDEVGDVGEAGPGDSDSLTLPPTPLPPPPPPPTAPEPEAVAAIGEEEAARRAKGLAAEFFRFGDAAETQLSVRVRLSAAHRALPRTEAADPSSDRTPHVGHSAACDVRRLREQDLAAGKADMALLVDCFYRQAYEDRQLRTAEERQKKLTVRAARPAPAVMGKQRAAGGADAGRARAQALLLCVSGMDEAVFPRDALERGLVTMLNSLASFCIDAPQAPKLVRPGPRRGARRAGAPAAGAPLSAAPLGRWAR